MEKAIYSSIFGKLTERTQIRFDEISKQHKQLFDNVIFTPYFDWDTPTIGLNFEELVGKYNVTIAATTVGENGKEPVRPTAGFETMKEKVLKHTHTYPLTIQEYRKVLSILDSNILDDTTKKKELVKIMWGTVTDAVAGILAKDDMIILGAMSNEGKCVINQENNPEGISATIDYGMPDENKATVTNDWTQKNIGTIDTFEDIQAILDASTDKVVFKEIWAHPSKITYILRTSKMKELIWGKDKSSTPLLLSQLNDFMQTNGFPVFKPIRRQVRIQNLDGTTKTYSPFNPDALVFVPDGKLGVIKNAYADSELRPEPGVSYSMYGRIRVSQWGVGETQASNGVEFTKAESINLPVIKAINGIYSLKTKK